jgi:hypothetical protein
MRRVGTDAPASRVPSTWPFEGHDRPCQRLDREQQLDLEGRDRLPTAGDAPHLGRRFERDEPVEGGDLPATRCRGGWSDRRARPCAATATHEDHSAECGDHRPRDPASRPLAIRRLDGSWQQALRPATTEGGPGGWDPPPAVPELPGSAGPRAFGGDAS